MKNLKSLASWYSIFIFSLLSLNDLQAAIGKKFQYEELEFNIRIGSIQAGKGIGVFEFDLKDDWKSYWKNGGDSGLPLEVDTSASSNIKSFEILWPSPGRFIDANDQVSFGYKHNVVLPFRFEIITPDTPSTLVLSGEYGVCKILCVPKTFEESFQLPLSFQDSAADNIFYSALAKVPKTISVSDQDKIKVSGDPKFIEIQLPKSIGIKNIKDVFIDGGDQFRFPSTIISLKEEIYTIIAPYERIYGEDSILRKQLEFTVVGFFNSFTFNSQIESFTKDKKDNESFYFWLVLLLSAFLGGLILNIMPCVLPVISLKLSHLTENKSRISKKGQLFYTVVGIISSLLLGGIVIYLVQRTGRIVGWGFHFQQPVFVIFLTAILLLFAFAQLGVLLFNISGEASGKLNQLLDKFSQDNPLFHLLYGVVITLLATPCTAPFLGSAVAFALSQSFWSIMLIFLMIGIGLSFPYILFIILPVSPTKILPKPGKWTRIVKHIAGILLYLSAIWLTWVLYQQISYNALLIFSSLHLVVLLFRKPNLAKVGILALVVIISSPAVFELESGFSEVSSSEDERLHWKTFNEDQIPNILDSGKTIFIDFTASWCITCKFNKLNVLNDNEVINALAQDEIYLMRGDLTQIDQSLLQYLKDNDRSGVPYNAIINKRGTKVLSEILNKEKLLNALRRTEGGT